MSMKKLLALALLAATGVVSAEKLDVIVDDQQGTESNKDQQNIVADLVEKQAQKDPNLAHAMRFNAEKKVLLAKGVVGVLATIAVAYGAYKLWTLSNAVDAQNQTLQAQNQTLQQQAAALAELEKHFAPATPASDGVAEDLGGAVTRLRTLLGNLNDDTINRLRILAGHVANLEQAAGTVERVHALENLVGGVGIQGVSARVDDALRRVGELEVRVPADVLGRGEAVQLFPSVDGLGEALRSITDLHVRVEQLTPRMEELSSRITLGGQAISAHDESIRGLEARVSALEPAAVH